MLIQNHLLDNLQLLIKICLLNLAGKDLTQKTIYHELVHVKQHEIGKLKVKGYKCFWKGYEKYWYNSSNSKMRVFSIKDYNDYYNAPHEIQARKLADYMLKKIK